MAGKGILRQTRREAYVMKEFWSEVITKKSWEKLINISKEFKFILIGGWAAYLWTEKHKSKDIDIVVDYKTLIYLKHQYELTKNERLLKYEIKLEDFDIDIYVSHYSKLIIDVKHLEDYKRSVKGIMTVSPEILVMLKQGAEIERRGTIKGKKDIIDILTMLYYSPFDIKKYRELLKKFSLERLENELKNEIRLFDDNESTYIGLNFNEIKKWKKQFLTKLIKL